jgi:hypothetical protein
MPRWIATVLLMLAAACAAGCTTHGPAFLPPARSYLRVREDNHRVVSLEVAVRTFARTNRPGPPVRLVGVTHLGDAGYYAGLQRLLDAQTLVLFEGVGAKDKRFMAARAGDAYSLQPALARALGLKFQLETIDYQGSNFVNSDLTLPQLQRVLESGAGADGGQLGDLVSLMDGSSWTGMFVRFGLNLIGSDPRLRATVRLAMIEALGALEVDLGDPKSLPEELRTLMAVLIAERNKAVVEDLRRFVDLQRQGRSRRGNDAAGVAVFYGAGHMVDLEKRLARDLGYRPVGEDWRVAFAVDPAAAGLGEAEVRFARGLVGGPLKALNGKR